MDYASSGGDTAAPAARRRSLLDGVGAVLNRAIRADEKTAYRVAELGECAIAFRLRRSGTTVVASVKDGAVTLTNEQVTADVTITGAPADFVAMARNQRDGTALAAGKVDIEGDLAIAQQIQNLMSGMSVDFEGLLAARTGDLVARQLGRGVRAGVSWVRDTHASLERDLSEYLRFEIRLLPTRQAIETFVGECRSLSADVDRLSARVARISQKRSLQ